MNTEPLGNIRSRQQPAPQPAGYVSYDSPVSDTQFQTEHQHSPISPIGSGNYFKAYGSTSSANNIGKTGVPKWWLTAGIIVVVIFFVFLVYYLVSSRSIDVHEQNRINRAFNENLMRHAQGAKNHPVHAHSKAQYQPPQKSFTVTTPAPANNINRNIAAQQAPAKREDKTAYVSSYDVSDDDPKENEPLEDDGTGPHDVDFNAYGEEIKKESDDRQSELDKKIKKQEDYELSLEKERLKKEGKSTEKDDEPAKKKTKTEKTKTDSKSAKDEKEVKEKTSSKTSDAEKEQPKSKQTKKEEVKKSDKKSEPKKEEPEKKTAKSTPEPKKTKKTDSKKREREWEQPPRKQRSAYNSDEYDEEDFAEAMNLLLQKGKKVKESRKYKKRNINKGRKNSNPYTFKYQEKEADDDDEEDEEDESERRKHHWDSFGMDDHGDERDDEYDQQYNTPKYRAPERPRR
ncbi:hypothetical protein AKO1_002216 [Acrasis kona]|uniref:Uncharacterized protein n=1 Tax=Acrasis kona TaxID=1008807 RepID=A0AAW2ZNG4_9EUKA